MPKEGNSFKIVLAPNLRKEIPKKAIPKRTIPTMSKEEKAKQSIPHKKGKYERKLPVRTNLQENSLFYLSELAYHTNSYAMQAAFAQEVGAENYPLVEALTNAYSFNENLGIIRTRLRKENAKIRLKKCLFRAPFNQNQSFAETIYKPGLGFIRNQNSIHGNRFGMETKNIMEKSPDQNMEMESTGGFICAGCRRTDTKKYARNLCQTCYKRQKKFLEGAEEQKSIAPDSVSHINEKPEPLPIPNKEWTGICPDCKR